MRIRTTLTVGVTFLVTHSLLANLSSHDVSAFLDNHCQKCHNEDKSKGDFLIESLIENPEITSIENSFDWEMVLDMLNLEEMPPAKEPQPTPEEVLPVIHWITETIEQHHANVDTVKPTALRRLNQSEYSNTIRDLFGIEFDSSALFPADETAEGFDNVGQALRISPTLLEKYLVAAETITERAITEGDKPAFQVVEAKGDALECDPSLGIKRDEGVELISGREFRSRVFSKQPSEYEGLYEVLVTVDPFRNEGEDVRVNLRIGPATNGPAALKSHKIFHISQTSTLKTTVSLKPGETIHVSYPDGPKFPNNNAGKDYEGPGIFIKEIKTSGPIIDQWPLAGQQRLFAPAIEARTYAGAKAILKDFAARAYRSQPSYADLKPLYRTFREQTKNGATFEEAIRTTLQLSLCSPKFIYMNASHRKNTDETIDPFVLASRLSYFLWSSTPDDALLAAAASGKLLEIETLQSQTKRLLEDPRSESFVSNFTGQWLKMREVGSMKPDRRFFPTYDSGLGDAMRAETVSFFEHLLHEDLSIYNFLDSSFTFLNERLAKHYGIDGVSGREFQKVDLANHRERGGIIGHASFHMITSNGTHTSPVARGVYVLDNLMGTPPPEPPPNIDPIEPDTRGATTMREQIEQHRESPTCYDCHQKIDPIGLALEGFDVVGFQRRFYQIPAPGGKAQAGPAVLTHSETADGRRLEGVEDLRAYLMENKHLFARNLAEKLLIYATGRKPSFQDEQETMAIASALEDDHPGLKTLVHEIVQSEAFRRP